MRVHTGPRLKNAETDKKLMMRATNLTKTTKNPNGGQNERTCVNRCNKNIIINN